MAYSKQNFQDGTVLTAAMLNKIEEGVVSVETTLGKISLRKGSAHIEFTTNGTNWVQLVALSDLKGAKGDAGAQGAKGDKGDAGVGLSGAAAQLTKIATPDSATAQDIATKVNTIIDQLIARGVAKA